MQPRLTSPWNRDSEAVTGCRARRRQRAPCQADGVAVIKATVVDVEAGEELDFLPFMQGVLE